MLLRSLGNDEALTGQGPMVRTAPVGLHGARCRQPLTRCAGSGGITALVVAMAAGVAVAVVVVVAVVIVVVAPLVVVVAPIVAAIVAAIVVVVVAIVVVVVVAKIDTSDRPTAAPGACSGGALPCLDGPLVGGLPLARRDGRPPHVNNTEAAP